MKLLPSIRDSLSLWISRAKACADEFRTSASRMSRQGGSSVSLPFLKVPKMVWAAFLCCLSCFCLNKSMVAACSLLNKNQNKCLVQVGFEQDGSPSPTPSAVVLALSAGMFGCKFRGFGRSNMSFQTNTKLSCSVTLEKKNWNPLLGLGPFFVGRPPKKSWKRIGATEQQRKLH